MPKQSTVELTLPHPPTMPLLSKEELDKLDGFSRELTVLLEEKAAEASRVQALKESAEAAESRLERAKEGEVEENGKRIADLNETTLALYIGKAESALIFARGKYRQASADSRRFDEEQREILSESFEYFQEILIRLMERERRAWADFATVYLDGRSPVALEVRSAYSASKVGAFLGVLWSGLQRSRTQTGENAASGVRYLIDAVKAGVKP